MKRGREKERERGRAREWIDYNETNVGKNEKRSYEINKFLYDSLKQKKKINKEMNEMEKSLKVDRKSWGVIFPNETGMSREETTSLDGRTKRNVEERHKNREDR